MATAKKTTGIKKQTTAKKYITNEEIGLGIKYPKLLNAVRQNKLNPKTFLIPPASEIKKLDKGAYVMVRLCERLLWCDIIY